MDRAIMWIMQQKPSWAMKCRFASSLSIVKQKQGNFRSRASCVYYVLGSNTPWDISSTGTFCIGPAIIPNGYQRL